MNAIAKKLLIKPNQRWAFVNAPENFAATLDPLPEGVTSSFEAAEPVDGLLLFSKNSGELGKGLKQIQSALKPDTVLWVVYPKKSSGIKSDLEMTGNWSLAAAFGLEPCAAAAIDTTWTALRFKPQGQSKPDGVANEALKSNQYGAYIDVENKQVILPPEIEASLLSFPLALQHYYKLSYSNKKEYVLWILTAKQEKTKSERLTKMIEKLLAGKKNPSEK